MMLQSLVTRFRRVPTERHIIVHNHAFKNAGTTIDWILRNNFGNRFVDHRDNAAMAGGAAYLEDYFRRKTQVQALASHHLALPLPRIDGVIFHLLMMYRHPLERVTSVYNFERAQTWADTLGARFARKHSLRDYVLWRMQPEIPPTIRNFHVYCSLSRPVQWARLFTDVDLDEAKHFARVLPLLGIVERFDESMASFRKSLLPFFPSISFEYEAQNVRQKKGETTEQRIERLRDEIGGDAFDLLVERNCLDLELYQYAMSIFNERLSESVMAG
jgi:hypothetical protein